MSGADREPGGARSHGRRFQRLPAGSHGISPAAVAESQRWRLLLAASELFAERGYAAMTSAEVTRRARVSAATFYRHYDDLEDCLGAATGLAAECIEELSEDCEGEEADLRAALAPVAAFLAAEPQLASVVAHEAQAVPAMAWRASLLRARLAAALAATLGRRAAGRIEALLVGAALGLLGSRGVDLTNPALTAEVAGLMSLSSAG